MSDLQLLRLPEAARLAQLSERTLRRAMHAPQNRLRRYKIGRSVRIARDDLTAWIRAQTAVPTVSDTIVGQLSPVARDLIQGLVGGVDTAAQGVDVSTGHLSDPADDGHKSPKMGTEKSAQQCAPTRLDSSAESSVHARKGRGT